MRTTSYRGCFATAACLVMSLCLLPACKPSERNGVLVALSAGPGTQRPEYVTLRWFAPGQAVASDHRLPDKDTLPLGGPTLGSAFFEIPAGAPGERRVLAVGKIGTRAVSAGAARIPYIGGRVNVTVVLVASLPDADADGLPDAIDDDCAAAGCPGMPPGDAGAGDASPVDAPVTAGPIDAGREPQPLGATCAAAGDCTSGFCVDGLCCDQACTGVCLACNLAGAQGRCTPVAAGDDPHQDCPATAAATCGTDGACDGRGACQVFSEGTPCAAATCSGSAHVPARTCDGKGVCRAAVPTTCGGYVCATPEVCATRCTTNAQCSTGNTCQQGVCSGPRPLGAACTIGDECVSKQCQQGVCCATACTGTCYSCNVADQAGTCVPVPAGSDPFNQCSDGGASGCGTDGACNGMGACRRYAAGTPCGSPTCSLGVASPPRTCDGNGSCRAAVTVPCAPYACAANQCHTACQGDSECASTAMCKSGVCVPRRGNGEACGTGPECRSGVCVRGICCDRACSGTCQACNLAAAVGTCTPVPAGQDPLDQCSAAAMACGLDGTCDGQGACRLTPVGSACGAGTCSLAVQTPPGACDGRGVCVASAPISCGRYQCATNACLATCLVDADCVAPNVCGGGACGGLRAEYFQGQDFTGPSVVRVDPVIDFDWGAGSPAPPLDGEAFSVRWTGTVTPRFSEEYRLIAGSDDGLRMWLDGVIIIDSWVVRSYTEESVYAMLTAGRAHAIVIEIYDQGGLAAARLAWESPSQPIEVVPTSALTPAP